MKTLYYNGTVHTLRTEEETFSAIGVQGNKILYLGDGTPEREKGYDRYISLEGMHVFPALTDSHLHLLYTMILSANSFTLCEVKGERIEPDSLDGIKRKTQAYCRSHPKQKIIVANQYIVSAVRERRLPNRFELDEWTGGRSMVIYNIDGHSSSLSTKLMKELGLPVEGQDGILSGEAHEFIQGKVTNRIASGVTPSVLAKGIANFSNLCARYGIGCVCAMDGNEDVKNDILTKALAFIASRMDIDVRLFAQYMDYGRVKWFRRYQRTPRAGGCGIWELDGSVGSHSAAFDTPYKDNGEVGTCYYEDAKIEEKVAEALEKGIQLSSHAIGEEAIDQIVKAYEKAGYGMREEEKGSRPLVRIDHFEFPSAAAVERVKRMPLAITVQPGFSWLDKRFLKSYEQFLPEEKVRQQIPLKELMEAGVCLCGSSDSPVQSVNPYEQMLGMTDFYLKDQSLSRYEALLTYTANPARMLGEEDERGILAVGRRADFMVMERNLLEADGGDPGDCRTAYMVKDGKRYREKKGTLPELLRMCLKRKKRI